MRALVFAVLGALLLVPRSASAIIDKTTYENYLPDASWVDETNDPDDPGWDSVASGGRNYVYLGDGWVITAVHVGVVDAQFLSQTYSPIPNQDYIVHNPTDWSVPLSTNSDLALFRIDGDPGLPDVTIATEPPPLGAEVTFIGRGYGRSPTEYHWNVNKSNPDNWVWTEVSSGGQYHGWKSAGTSVKRWGTNAIASDEQFYDPNANPQKNIQNDSDWDHVFSVSNRDVIALATTFEQTGGTAHEAQAIGGNSGSAVFYNRSGNWELAGIINAVGIYQDQPQSPKATAMYGNATFFSDLSVYHDEIYNIINAHAEYSLMGDVNLDGVISGDGTGTADVDDVTAFVDGWLYEQPTHSVESWKKGDLSLDGKTDLADFLLLRNALLTSGSGTGAAALSSLLGMGPIVTVPEPASAALLLIGVLSLVAAAKRRARLAAR